jgi:UDP:flavonoid glycosyltransferase YjiC (YdhE family)
VQCFCARAKYDAPDLRQAIAEERPDALLVDINSWGALAAEAWGRPWAAVCPYPLAIRSRDVPRFGPGLAPAAGRLGRLRDTLLRPVVLGAIEHAMGPSLNEARRQLQLDPLKQVDDMFRRPPLVLYLTAEPFEYRRRDWPDNIVMIGPCDWDPPSESPGWLSEITGPIVLVTTS